jgi:hypothetical protein
MVKTEPEFRIVSIPVHETLDKGTLHRILTDSDLTIEDFLKALKKKL